MTKEHVMWALAAMGAILAMAAAYLQGGAIAALSAGSAACLRTRFRAHTGDLPNAESS